MDLTEIVNLINIRQYVCNSTANPTLDRAAVNYMNNILLMLDKKIYLHLQDDEFKDYVNYQDIRKTIEEVAKITNIKSGLKK